MTLGAGPGLCGPKGPKFILYKVMLHIKSKVMKNRIQWCKYFAPGACLEVTRGQKVGFWVPFFYCNPALGTWPGVFGPDGSKSILYKHSRVAYQIEDNEE